MITVDQLEVLLRSVPAYFLFGGLAVYLYSWIEKKPKMGIIAEAILIIAGIAGLVVMLSGMIPSPMTEGLVADHIQKVIKMLFLLCTTGALALASLIVRTIKKTHSKVLVLITFGLALFLFFSSTRLAKIPFQLNVPVETTVGE